MRQAWVAGSTGLVGNLLSRKIASMGVYDRVINLVRSVTRASGVGISSDLIVDYEHLSLQPEPEADFFCCLGSTIKKAGSQDAFRKVDEDYVVRFAWEAKKAEARCLVVISSIGADPKANAFYLRVKGEMEAGVRRTGLRSIYILRPSLLVGHRQEQRLGERVAIAMAPLISLVSVGPLRKYKPITADRVADIAIQCAAQARPGFHVLEGFE